MTRQTPSTPCARRHRGERGLSIVEVLISAAILLFVVVGVVPMVTRSMSNNLAGNDASQVTNGARSRVEEFFQLPFLDPAGTTPPLSLTVTTGDVRQYDDYYSRDSDRWFTSVQPDTLWSRTTYIRQHRFDDLTTALAAGAPAESIHLKSIEVEVDSARTAGPLAAGKRVVLRQYKAF